MDQFPEVETCIEVNLSIRIVMCFCNFCAKADSYIFLRYSGHFISFAQNRTTNKCFNMNLFMILQPFFMFETIGFEKDMELRLYPSLEIGFG